MTYTIPVAIISAAASAGLMWYWLAYSANGPAAKVEQGEHKDRLHGLIEATVGTTGEAFFYALVRELSQYLAIDAMFLATCVDEEKKLFQSLAYWCDSGYIMNHELSLQHSPCGENGSFWHMENSSSELFPQVSLLQAQFKVSGFFAIELQDSSGRLIGLLGGMNRAALHPDKNEVDVIRLFSARASAELERKLSIGETLMEIGRPASWRASFTSLMITSYDATASFDSLVNGTQTLAIWIINAMRPWGMPPRGWVRPYFFQPVPVTACVIAQAPC